MVVLTCCPPSETALANVKIWPLNLPNQVTLCLSSVVLVGPVEHVVYVLGVHVLLNLVDEEHRMVKNKLVDTQLSYLMKENFRGC